MGHVWNWLRDAWMGWTKYTDAGKLVVLALAVLLYLGFFAKNRGSQKKMVRYGMVAATICICPVTAAVLMFYQTRFYDYQWIWSVVPLTALIALGGTVFLTDQWNEKKEKSTWVRNAFVTLASVTVVFLCGNLGESSVDVAQAREDRVAAQVVLEEVRARYGEDLCLWAPAEILEYARLEGNMELYYGRNMWDAALDAYSYETYSPEQKRLYQWMETLDDWDIQISIKEIQSNLEHAFADGVDCVLLPTEMSDWLQETETKESLPEYLGEICDCEVTELTDFYLMKKR